MSRETEKKYKVTQFEYDYLMAQKKVDVSIDHINLMIERGYFKSLEEFFVLDKRGRQYLQIGTIRDLMDRLEVEIPVQSHKNIVKHFISMVDSFLFEINARREYGDEKITWRTTYYEIVHHLLLRDTDHAGGASTRAKCEELGYDHAEQVVFGADEDDI